MDEQKQPIHESHEDIELLKKRMNEYLDGWKRAKADYINYKRETEKREKEMIQFAHAALVLELLPIYNNFRRAFQHVPQDQKQSEWVRGMEAIKKQFEEFLKQTGIEVMNTVGRKFNPEFHDAVSKEKRDGVEKDTILEEVDTGFLMNGKVLAHAKVKVAE